ARPATFASSSPAEFRRWTNPPSARCRESIRLGRCRRNTPAARFPSSSGLTIRGKSEDMLKTTVLTRGKSNLPLLLFLLILPLTQVAAQDWIRTGTNRGAPIRLAAPDFKGANTDPQTSPLNSAFNETLWNDLENAGLF